MKTRTGWIIALLCGLFLLAACGGGGSEGSQDPPPGGDTTAPTGGATPASGSLINGSTSFVVAFSEAMDTATLVLGGALAGEDDGGAWSSTAFTNDTITISPASTWGDGSARSLAVDASDAAGNPAATLSLSYDVDAILPTISSATPTSGNVISTGTQIVVRFSEAMGTASLVLGNTLSAEDDGGVWSTTTFTNDTLTISPASAWNGGAARGLTVNAQDLAGNAVSTLNLSYDVDATLPTATPAPGNGSSILTGQSIVITFSESMNTGTLSLTGTIAGESDGGVWSTALYTDDTLTISPATSWTEGAGRTLIVDVEDLYFNALSTLSLTLNPDATNPGTAGVTPTSSSTISGSQQIVVQFDETMDRPSLALAGTMAAESDGGVWSNTSETDDTLTISPSSAWAGGAGRTLTVNADDLVGLPLTQLDLSYDVDALLPTAGAAPTNGATIPASQIIVVTFSESMDTGTLALGGNMAAQSDGGVWSTTTFTDDTLTFSPTTSWTGGAGRTLTVDADDLSGNAISTLNLSYTVDATAPAGSASPVAPAVINEVAPIVITFNESMNTAALLLGGTMGAECDGGAWSTTTNTNDTLTVSPSGNWSSGSGATLTIDGEDANGNALPQMSLTYNVIEVSGALYFVSTTGSDSNSGLLPNAAKATLFNAIANAGGLDAAVLVASGTYNTGAESPGFVRLVEGVSLYGGFSSDYLTRGAAPTLLVTDGSSTCYAVRALASSGLTNSTVVDGFTIQAVYYSACGISAPLDLRDAAPTIRNNVLLSAPTASGNSYGIKLQSASPVIVNNTIVADGGSSSVHGIFIQTGVPTIINNVIVTSAGSTQRCIGETGTGSDPTELKNNDLRCPTLYFDADTTTSITLIGDVNALTDIPGGVSGNVSADPVFTNAAGGDFHLSAGSPTSVTEGGLDLSADFTTDKDDVLRTVPWSIGAYEF